MFVKNGSKSVCRFTKPSSTPSFKTLSYFNDIGMNMLSYTREEERK